MKISYNWLQTYFKEKLPVPEKLAEAIVFGAFEIESIEKIEKDIIFDIKVLPDRAHDCLSHWGIAKEISGILGLEIKEKEYKIFDSKSTELKIEIQDNLAKDGASKCVRYMGRIIRNVKVGASPDWLKEKLEIIGQKSINNIVDATNFVMFDLGQPIHCFDLDKLESSKIIVRNAKNDEKITTLDKKEINLDDSILVIADGSTGSPQANEILAIAGIKGGTKAEVSSTLLGTSDQNTKNIVIEVANFNPISTRKTSKKINILTDAVKRYENEISPELCEKAMNSITDLIFNLAGGEVEDIIDIYPAKSSEALGRPESSGLAGSPDASSEEAFREKQKERKISFSVDFINKKLGEKISASNIEDILKKYNYQPASPPASPSLGGSQGGYKFDNGNFEIIVPTLRLDLNIPEDMVEEIGRVYGYEKISPKIPKINFKPKINEIFYKILFARNKLLNDGYSEVMTYSFCNSGEVEVFASASDKKFLRTNLTDGLKESYELNKNNLSLLGLGEVKIFEIGAVFTDDSASAEGYGGTREEIHVAYADKKGVTEKSLEDFCKDVVIGDSYDVLLPTANYQLPTTFVPWSVFPFISRDIAVWLPDEVSSDELVEIIKQNGTDLLMTEPKLFDKFFKPARLDDTSRSGGNNRTSYAYRLVFQSMERTLRDEEVNKIMDKIYSNIKERGWEVR